MAGNHVERAQIPPKKSTLRRRPAPVIRFPEGVFPLPTLTTSADPRAWTHATLDAPERWYYRLPNPALESLHRVLDDLRRNPRPLTKLKIPAAEQELWTDAVRPVLEALETDRGFVVVQGLDRATHTNEELTAGYWIVGQALGRPFEQNVQGTVLYDVKDTGASVYQGARFSVTNAESTYHTDNSFGETVLDYVALLCLATAKSGGLSQIVSGWSVVEELRRGHRDALEVLSQPFHVDRRGGVKLGQGPTAEIPVIDWQDGELLLRYLRFWIEAGHEKIGQPLTDAQRSALDTLDEVAARRELRAEFALQPGDMLFANNRWTLHNRTAFEDYAEPERRRHLVRLWLQR